MAHKTGAAKLSKLRELMQSVPVGGLQKGIQAIVVDTGDAHQSEYIREHDQRRRFISGFAGSRGTAVITPDKALLWTDGRYFTQAAMELDPPEAWTIMKNGLLNTPTTEVWLANNLPPKSTVGADPNLLSSTEWATLHAALNATGHALLPLSENLVDKVWGDDQPPAVLHSVVAHPPEYSGRSSGEKLKECREAMKENRATLMVLTGLDEVAYLLNLRGSDIPYNPVFFAYVVVTLDEVHIFMDTSRLAEEAREQLIREEVNPVYHAYDDVHAFLRSKAATATDDDRVWISGSSSYAIHMACGETKKHNAITQVKLMLTVKNDVEVQGMKNAHVRDSVALVKYLAWLEDRVKRGERVTEISGATRLEEFRREQDRFVGLSFPTISSVGAHGAIIHYIPSTATDVPITDKEMYLCDSGAQYKDGTTDVTRTVHFGKATEFERECFTRVFKGHCRLAKVVFPFALKGNYLDSLARESLWSVGLNYMHGTGHSIGAYLNVHEEPPGIQWRPCPLDPGLRPGMFLSNEPGYYEENKFGVRIENIQLVVPAKTPYNFTNQGYLTFETVTLVPIQTSLLDLNLLTDTEIEYLNEYHAKCSKTLQPFLQGPENELASQWLERNTRPISR